MTDNGTTTTYCYDHADRLTSTSDTRYTNPTYDAHGNTVGLGDETLGYDGADRHLTTTVAATARSALFVVGNPAVLTANDTLLRDRLVAQGWQVTVADDGDPDTAAAGKQLVLISDSAGSTALGTKYRTVNVPVVVWEYAVFDDLALTGTVQDTDFGKLPIDDQVVIAAGGHPLTGGLTGTVAVRSANESMTWGKPAATATVAATHPQDPTKATVFGYDTGATMVGLTAPARRVGLFLYGSTTITTSGLNLFDAAVNWAAPSTSRSALLVVGDPGAMLANDTLLRNRLVSNGWQVTVADDGDPDTAAAGKQLVLISDSAGSTALGTKYRTVNVPVVVWEYAVFDDLALTGTVQDTDFGKLPIDDQVVIAAGGHPLAGGLTGTVTVRSADQNVAWGKPSASATVAATHPQDATKATIFGYDTGATMVGLTAPARRVGFFLYGSTSITANGLTLFDAVVNWAAPSTSTVRYVRDATDRIVARYVDGNLVARYGHAGPTDGAAVTLDGSNAVIERIVTLIGGAMVTTRASGNVWSYPNIHGDVVAATNSAGVKQGSTVHYDPYGQALATPVDNAAGQLDYGWLGQHLRPFESQDSVNTIEMGARPYISGLGRFLETDPVEGGTPNEYVYVGDPVNQKDLSGKCEVATEACILGILQGKESLPIKFVQWGADRCGCRYTVVGGNTDAGHRLWLRHGSCSNVSNTGPSWDFTRACQTHDLGYDLLRFFGTTGRRGHLRRAVDALFHRDMDAHCSRREPLVSDHCYLASAMYSAGVDINSARQFYAVP